jgi:hypothetical protein
LIEFSISQGPNQRGAWGGVSGRTEEVDVAGAGGLGEVTILPGVGETPAIEAATVWTPYSVKHVACFGIGVARGFFFVPKSHTTDRLKADGRDAFVGFFAFYGWRTAP